METPGRHDTSTGWLMEKLTQNRTIHVIAPDFVGYDLSSHVRWDNGSLEGSPSRGITISRAEIISIGRSIGDFSVAQWLGLPGVNKSVLIAAAGSEATLIKGAMNSLPCRLLTLFAMFLLHRAWENGHAKGDRIKGSPDQSTQGFFAPPNMFIALEEPVSDKSVLLFRTTRDQFIPSAEAVGLADELRKKGFKTKIVDLPGNHDVLPWDDAAKEFAPQELRSFIATGISR
ncbi:hypothetical protein NOR_06297 [Metarhizium rileyi]|uniref:Peptidase S9 prolyl oligopeptidase catalytic domain-containing protein n=1 Tax=Metarhizium rileyi (strain RCEF 4871) TaxID=1649241 RepID=A0A167AYH8_METRR|nr:hypothetical protein NOR_06297 [Metarhizium rileyi RCEF 4871]